ncbi:MAG: J domain-containing protein [Chloroflexi bacterium]|nr:J domain-containing protein [Chloroflexota bacterium]
MARDFYEVLGVPRGADDKAIRSAFRKLARQYHPDVNPGDEAAEERFEEISEAHAVLSNADTRAAYDRYGDRWRDAEHIEEMRKRGAGPFGAGGPFGFGGGGDARTFEFNLGDIGGDGSGGFGGIFDGLFGRGDAAPRAPRRGRDIDHPVEVTLQEAYDGTTRTIEIAEESAPCTVCGGSGSLAGATCHSCRGGGRAGTMRRIEVTIPPGIGSDQRVRVRGQGERSLHGGQPGDLFLIVTVNRHPRFERRNADLHIDVDVPVTVAALGGEVRVPTVKGRTLALTIPAGTRSGHTFRLAGQGMPRRDGGGFGDLHARALLQLPEHLGAEQLELIGRLRASEDGNPGTRTADEEASTPS